jgi:hypothetical protein
MFLKVTASFTRASATCGAVYSPSVQPGERVPGRERGASPEEVAGGICMAKMTKAKQPN